MIRRFFVFAALLAASLPSMAQRATDRLDRGLIAVDPRDGKGVFLSWRIQADEYFDVTYNVYRNGTKLNATPLTTSNYKDESGNLSATYTVRAVVDGVEQKDSKAAKVFGTGKEVPKNYAGQPGYVAIKMKDVVDRNGNTVFSVDRGINTWDYSLNDVSMADLDGDGEVEFIVKRINERDARLEKSSDGAVTKYLYDKAVNRGAYTLIEAYKFDGTRLWWIDCGPNMVSLNSTEINCVAYDWDKDGKAEVLMRGADNMIIHMADGKTYNVGDMSVNTRADNWDNAQYAWTNSGAEYLLYLNGATATPYSITEYPLRRLEAGETNQAWWPGGKPYGHRASKYFFGAPFLDGRKASIFLARGIYTQTKMVALDVDPATHKLTQRWYWKCNTPGSPWYGQGNHNMTIADVDGDGCDEIVYGSMTIDNNGKGLSTTGLGHGDALHVSDLDPFRKGIEVFACNEEKAGNNYRNATTSEIYYRNTADNDDGRAMAGNFTNDYPGAIAASVSSGIISTVANKTIEGLSNNCFMKPWSPMSLNGRIYWDGDLLEEAMDSPGTASDAVVSKNGNRLFQSVGCKLTNDSKNNPCAQGDIIGDWREELILRSADNKELRVYSTDVPTSHRIPSLWYDHEYRQAMVWQVCAYNQPPHVSFFLGELEGITEAPVPLTDAGRTEIKPNNSISASHNGSAVMICDAGNYGIDIEGANPSMLVVNVPSQVSGSDDNNGITYTYSTTQLGATIGDVAQKGDLGGKMRLIKQGDGLLKLTARTFSYSGETQIWSGSLYFRGTLSSSDVWMNRHTNFYCGATIPGKLTMEYGSALHIGRDATDSETIDCAQAKIGHLEMHEGSRVVLQMTDEDKDQIEIGSMTIRKQSWQYGPKYLAPVFEIQSSMRLQDGKYKIGTIEEVATGDLSDVIVECSNVANTWSNRQIVAENGNLYLVIGEYIPGAEPETYEASYMIDFEEASDVDKFAGNATLSQQAIGGGSHCLHIDQAAGSGDRYATIDFTAESDAFGRAEDYDFEFDYGIACSNQNDSKLVIKSTEGDAILSIVTPAYGATTAYDAAGNALGTLVNDGYSKAFPTKMSHIRIHSSENGTTVTIISGGTIVVSSAKVSSELVQVGSMEVVVGRAVSHAAVDDIVLNVRKLSDTTDCGDVISDDDTVEAIYSVTGVRLSEIASGVNIIMMSNGKVVKVIKR